MKRLAFSDDMMRALAAGEKTMTRRIEKRELSVVVIEGVQFCNVQSRLLRGDLVAATCAFNSGTNSAFGNWKAYRFQFAEKDLPMFDPNWKPARVMPAALAPFVLRITEVRAERLGEITDQDALREGMHHWGSRTLLVPRPHAPREVFGIYWNQLYGRKPLVDAWTRDRNAWVWVYGFEVAERRFV